MIKPGEYDFTIYRGSTDQFRFRILGEDSMPIPHTDIQFTITVKNASEPATPLVRKKLSDDDPGFEEDDYSGIITWTPTPAESRALPVGEAKAKYEIELRNGPTQLIYLIGTITALGGINDD